MNTTTDIYKIYNPAKPRRAAAISDEVWDIHKPFILEMHNQKLPRSAMLVRLEREHNFHPSMGQLIARLGKWDCKVIEKHPSDVMSLSMQPMHNVNSDSGSSQPDHNLTSVGSLNSDLQERPIRDHQGLQQKPSLRGVYRSSGKQYLLEEAFAKATEAVQLDNIGLSERAKTLYTACYNLLTDVKRHCRDTDDTEQISAILIWCSKQLTNLSLEQISLQEGRGDFVPPKVSTPNVWKEETDRCLQKLSDLTFVERLDPVAREVKGSVNGIAVREQSSILQIQTSQSGCEERDDPKSRHRKVKVAGGLSPSWTAGPFPGSSEPEMLVDAVSPTTYNTEFDYSMHPGVFENEGHQQRLQDWPIVHDDVNQHSQAPSIRPSSTLSYFTDPFSIRSSISSDRASMRSLLSLAIRIRNLKSDSKTSLNSMSVKTSSTSSFHRTAGFEKDDMMSID